MTEEQFLLFAAYTDNELTQQQDAAVMELLNNNPALMQEFEMELMLRRGINKEEILSAFSPGTITGYETADTHIDNITNALEEKEEGNAAIPFSKKYMPLMAAAAFILIAVMAWLFFYRPGLNNIAHNNMPDSSQTKNDSNIIKVNPAEKINNPIAQNTNTQNLFAQNYSQYEGSTDDPVELSICQSLYRQKKYSEVIAIKKEDYQTRGTNDTAITLYADFYKALSYLETQKITQGKNILDKIINSKETPLPLLYNTQWYRALAALQINEIAPATELLKKVEAQKKSPWKQKAADLLNILSDKE